MKKKIKFFTLLLFAIGLSGFFGGCGNAIALFDHYAYTQTTSLKVDVLNLIDKSGESYSLHLKEVEAVTSDLMKIKEYEKHRAKDIITFKMWDKMIDSTGQKGLIGSYLIKWKNDDKEKPVFISEAKALISQGFDLIAELESSKIKPNDAGAQKFLTK